MKTSVRIGAFEIDDAELRGEAQGAPNQRIFWRSGPYRAVRDGDWKLIGKSRDEVIAQFGGMSQCRHGFFGDVQKQRAVGDPEDALQVVCHDDDG